MINSRKQVALGASLICFIMAFVEFFQPLSARPTGRWSILFGPIWDEFGSSGIVGYWFTLGLVSSIVFFWSKK